ncbi:MAG: ABC transporter permease [Promethearchaeota archaeon]
MNMVKYISKRILMMFPMLLGVLIITWLLSSAMLINPIINRLGMVRDPAIYALEMERLGLNDPWYIQLSNYIIDFFTGNLGKSYTLYPDKTVSELLLQIFPKTIELMIFPIVLVPIIAVKLGVISARNRNKRKDILIRFLAVFGAGFPSFWVAGLFQYYFGIYLKEITFNHFDIDIMSANSLDSPFTTNFPTTFILNSILIILILLIIGVIFAYRGFKIRKRKIQKIITKNRSLIFILLGLVGFIMSFISLFYSISSIFIYYILIEFLIAFATLISYVIVSNFIGKNPKINKTPGKLLTISGISMIIVALIPLILYISLYGTQFRTIDSILFNNTLFFWDTIGHLILPTLSMTFVSLAGITRQTRSSMLDVLNQDYIRTARAKGVSEKDVINKHALRNALIPTSNLIIGGTAAALLGSVYIEKIFNYQGFGYILFEAIWNGDIPVINGCILYASLIILASNLIADVMYTIIDPRIVYT